jgi:HSP20 family protein
MADMARRQTAPVRSVFGDILGFDPFRMTGQSDLYGIDVRRTDNGYEIDVPMAGFRPEDVSITSENGVVTIEGRNERRRFTRSVALPEEVDEERIDARVEHGMLTLTLPFTPKAQPRRIEIRVGGEKSVGGKSARDTAIGGTAETTST